MLATTVLPAQSITQHRAAGLFVRGRGATLTRSPFAAKFDTVIRPRITGANDNA
jgi:hypothetical protein